MILPRQLATITALIAEEVIDHLDLLWMPGHILVTIWELNGQYSTCRVDEDGFVIWLTTT